jgi:NAD(P)H-quinone oxidoreductase subunit 5
MLAALVMTTRISVKLRLAWSTCAQMGLMLTECGLGLFDLALLHLVAHSLYKAYAFLSAGEAVMHMRLAQMQSNSPPRSESAPVRSNPAVEKAHAHAPTGNPTRTLLAHLLAAPIALGLVAAGLAPWHWLAPAATIPVAALIILGLGLASLLAPMGAEKGRLSAALIVLGLTQLYGLWHLVFAQLIAPMQAHGATWATVWVALNFAALYLIQVWIAVHPQGRLSRSLYPWAYAGFHLDERFTRLTFALWPLAAPAVKPRFSAAWDSESFPTKTPTKPPLA